MEKELMKTLSEHGRLGIAQQFDYSKFLLYSLITQSTAIEGSTVTEVESQLLFDEGIPPEKHNLSEVMMNLDLLNAYQMSIQLANQHRDYSFEMLRALSTAVLKNTGSRYNTALGTFDSSKGDFRKVNVSAGSSGKSYIIYTNALLWKAEENAERSSVKLVDWNAMISGTAKFASDKAGSVTLDPLYLVFNSTRTDSMHRIMDIQHLAPRHTRQRDSWLPNA